MRRRLVPAIVIAALIAGAALTARAAVVFIYNHGTPAPAYVGPGDAVGGAIAWYGMRGYNAAYANGSNYGIRMKANSISYDILILSTGNLDISTAVTDAGTSGTGSCTISGTTMSCATGTGILSQFSTLTGAGLVQPAWISSATCSSFPCTMTLNTSQTVAVAETITALNVMQVETLYDQSGANYCTGTPCNISGGSGLNLIPTCQNGKPCFTTNQNNGVSNTTTIPSTNVPITFSAAYLRTSFTASSSYNSIFSTFNGTSGQPLQGGFNAANTATVYAGGSACSATANDNAAHAVQGVANGASSFINVDGTATSCNAGSGAAFTKLRFGQDPAGGDQYNGYIFESGLWSSALSTANQALLCHNQYNYWATATSC